MYQRDSIGKSLADKAETQESSDPRAKTSVKTLVQTKSLFSPYSDKKNGGTSPHADNTGIPAETKEKFESLSGLSFDDVKVHYNSDKPAQLQALAYTSGSQVYIAPGQEMHLEHELGHVVQQKQGRVSADGMLGGAYINNDAALEAEADSMAHRSPFPVSANIGKGAVPEGEKVVQRWSVPVHSSIIEYAYKSMTTEQMDELDTVFQNGREDEVPEFAGLFDEDENIGLAGLFDGDANNAVLNIDQHHATTADVAGRLDAIRTAPALSKERQKTLRNIKKGSAWNDLTTDSSDWEDEWLKFTKGAWLGVKLKLPGAPTTEVKKIQSSHHGAMQFLHAQADVLEPPARTRDKMIDWAHTCYEICLMDNNTLIPPVAGGAERNAITLRQALNNANIALPGAGAQPNPQVLSGALHPFLDQPLSKFFNTKIASDTDEEIPDRCAKIRQRALGSLTHMIQDSFNHAHGQRTAGKRRIETDHGSFYAGKLKNFTVYDQQSGSKHKKYDLPSRAGEDASILTTKLTTDYTKKTDKLSETEGFLDAVQATRVVMDFVRSAAVWNGGPSDFFNELFALDDNVANPGNIAGWQAQPVAGPPTAGPRAAEVAQLREGCANLVNSALSSYNTVGQFAHGIRALPSSGKTLRKKSIEELAKKADINAASIDAARDYDEAVERERAGVNHISGTRIEIINHKLVLLNAQRLALLGVGFAISTPLANPTGEQAGFLTELKKEALDILIDARSLLDEANQM